MKRREFLQTSAVAGAAAYGLSKIPAVHAAENNTLKIGLVGCGGRGRGAVSEALTADPNTKVVAIADAFEAKVNGVADFLQKEFEDRVSLKETKFHGLEAYKQVIDLCDVVLLCEVPHFRPMSLRYAVEKGKHIFCEKPVAVDAPGIRSVLESAKIAREKNLNLVSGLCWRYDLNVQDMMKRVQDGAIGDVLHVRETYLTGKLWNRPRQPGDTEMMFQVNNWLYFSWLSGDFNVEQHVHSLDKGLWAFNDVPPAAAFGVGGRMSRTEQPIFGNIYDQMGVVYEYPDGRSICAFARQQDNCFNNTDDYFTGTLGHAQVLQGTISGKNPYKQQKVASNMYVQEHIELSKAIRGNRPYINNGEYMAYSTMLGILGREVCYTGKRITWDEMMSSDAALAPSGYTWDSTPPALPDENGRYKIPIPGGGLAYHQVVR
ncbi:MAG: Gfo/Idh/MocA family oxidoreductase [Planctomycetaceae bacterium]|nr:Gfo/Idh/MocA family oxidoreductase [Planctomycetaceae bacterium]